MVNRKVDRIIMPKLSSALGEITNKDRNSYKKILKGRNLIKSNLDQIVSNDYKRHVIDKLQNVTDPYLLKKNMNLFEWDCGCLLTEEQNNVRLCDCPIPNNHGNNSKRVIATDCDTNEESIYRSI